MIGDLEEIMGKDFGVDFGRHTGVVRQRPPDGFLKRFNFGQDRLRIRMQLIPPSRDLTVKAPHSDVCSKVDKEGVEKNTAFSPAPGTEGG